MNVCMYVLYIYIYVYKDACVLRLLLPCSAPLTGDLRPEVLGSPSTFPHPAPLSWRRYDIFSGAVHIKLHYDALNIFHTGGSVEGVGVEIVVLMGET